MAMRVCMLAERCRNAAHAPVKNCDPDQASTGSVRIPIASQIHHNAFEPLSGTPGKISG